MSHENFDAKREEDVAVNIVLIDHVVDQQQSARVGGPVGGDFLCGRRRLGLDDALAGASIHSMTGLLMRCINDRVRGCQRASETGRPRDPSVFNLVEVKVITEQVICIACHEGCGPWRGTDSSISEPDQNATDDCRHKEAIHKSIDLTS